MATSVYVTDFKLIKCQLNLKLKACFIRRISVASNTIRTIDNEMIHLIIHCLNCIRRDRNATYKTGRRNITNASAVHTPKSDFKIQMATSVCVSDYNLKLKKYYILQTRQLYIPQSPTNGNKGLCVRDFKLIKRRL